MSDELSIVREDAGGNVMFAAAMCIIYMRKNKDYDVIVPHRYSSYSC